jgi:hypothetical protein
MKALIFGAGGAGDCISAILAMNYYKKLGYETILGSIIWERYVIDPVPGPINFEDLRNAVKFNDCIYLLNEKSYAIRANQVVIPTLVKVIRTLEIENGIALNNKLGPNHLALCIKEFAEKENIKLIIGVDAGGDVLARGNEESLISPLVDAISLATMLKLKQYGFNVIIGVIGCGSDGEISHEDFLKRISEIAKMEGLIDIKGYDIETAEIVKNVLKEAESEASKIPLDAFLGYYGEVEIRKRTRKVFVTPTSSVMFLLDPIKVASINILSEVVKEANSLEEANSLLNKMGIYTEYNFEIDAFKKYGIEVKNIDGETFLKIRSEGKKRLLIEK